MTRNGENPVLPEGGGIIKPKPTSFLLHTEDKERLKEIVASLQKMTGKKISEAMVVRALLLQGTEMKPEKLLELIRQIIF